MNDKLIESLKNLEIHADVLMKIPASEQHIGGIQSVVSIAMLEIKRAIEALAEDISTAISTAAAKPSSKQPKCTCPSVACEIHGLPVAGSN